MARCSVVLSLTLLAAIPLRAQEPNFGRAVVMTASELVIGQPVNWYGPGTVYSYSLDASGQWRERSRVTASDTARMDDFGRSIALDGNTMAVGAPRKNDGAGVLYLFTRSGPRAPWRELRRIEAPAAGGFAAAVALSGDDLFVGAPGADSIGAVYHYRRADGAWSFASVIQPASRVGGGEFGSALAVRDGWMLVGAPREDAGAGRVYAVRQESDGRWGSPSTIGLPRTTAPGGARVGTTVVIDGDRALVGAPGAMQVHLLSRDQHAGWSADGELRPFDGGRGTQFGAAIALVGNEVWVGAPGANGRLYRFLPNTTGGWQSAVRFDADSADGTSWPFAYGYAIAGAAGRAAVSMPTRDFGEGRVLAATLTGATWRSQQLLVGEIFAIGGGVTPAAHCADGKIGAFTCTNIELTSHMPMSALGGERGAWVNDVWGWTDPSTRKDYALVARRDGTSFVDLTNPATPRLVATLPRTIGSPPSVWRDIKVIGNHAYIVADGAGAHGMQIFDLTRLRSARNVPTFAPDSTYRGISSAHNVVADTSSGFLYIVGANGGGETCGGGLHIVDARRPTQLTFMGCYNDKAGANSQGSTHDAQCLTYQGPDAKYRGREICVGSNAREINIADVTDKAKPVTIGRNSYPNVSYAHQGWFDAEQRYFYMNDEGDELAGLVEGTRTIVWDLTDLSDPVVVHMYIGPVKSSDHNLYVVGDRMYQSNYASGLRVLDIKDRRAPREIAFFDSAPFNQDEPGYSAAVSGAWSNYPFFKSGVIVFTSVREGLFVVRVRDLVP